jgi:hypothetical protein
VSRIGQGASCQSAKTAGCACHHDDLPHLRRNGTSPAPHPGYS